MGVFLRTTAVVALAAAAPTTILATSTGSMPARSAIRATSIVRPNSGPECPGSMVWDGTHCVQLIHV
jgi:hypothetical protein